MTPGSLLACKLAMGDALPVQSCRNANEDEEVAE